MTGKDILFKKYLSIKGRKAYSIARPEWEEDGFTSHLNFREADENSAADFSVNRVGFSLRSLRDQESLAILRDHFRQWTSKQNVQVVRDFDYFDDKHMKIFFYITRFVKSNVVNMIDVEFWDGKSWTFDNDKRYKDYDTALIASVFATDAIRKIAGEIL